MQTKKKAVLEDRSDTRLVRLTYILLIVWILVHAPAFVVWVLLVFHSSAPSPAD